MAGVGGKESFGFIFAGKSSGLSRKSLGLGLVKVEVRRTNRTNRTNRKLWCGEALGRGAGEGPGPSDGRRLQSGAGRRPLGAGAGPGRPGGRVPGARCQVPGWGARVLLREVAAPHFHFTSVGGSVGCFI